MELLVNIDVDDLDKAVDFYRRAVGLESGRRLFGGAIVEMLGASARIYLLAKAPGTSASSSSNLPRDYRRHWTPVHLDFVVDDIDAAVARALAAGAALEGPIQSDHWGRLARLSDPFGHGLCLVQFSETGYDAAAAGAP